MRRLVDTLTVLRQHRRSLLLYHLFFTGLTLAILGPAIGALLAALEPVTGEGVISTGGIATFLLSPGGLLWLAVTLTALMITLALEQAGMTLIVASTRRTGEYRLTLVALWQVARRFGKLLRLTMLQVVAHLCVALPFLLVIALAWWTLLSSYEVYFIRLTRPPELWWFAAIAGVTLVAMLLCNGWLFLRWSLAEPIITLEQVPVRRALVISSQRIHGSKSKLLVPLVAVGALLFILPALFTWFFQLLGTPYLALMPDAPQALLPAITVYIALYLLLMVIVTFGLSAGYSLLIYQAYRVTGGHPEPEPGTTPPSVTGARAWLVEAALLAIVVIQAVLVVSAFDTPEDVAITAHRGNAFLAPENTASAMERAIQDGADYLEVDVRMTRDGELVLWHDADLKRLLDRPERISALYWNDIRELDAGGWFAPEYAGETILTLRELIEIARGRVGLFLDLKPDHNSRDLTRQVVSLLQEMDAVEGTVIAAAERYVLREAKTLAPELKTALLAQFVIGPLNDQGFDILGLRYNQANAGAVARARQLGYELHVWTVNQPAEMSRMIDMGVDNIITDRPDVLARLLTARADLTDAERLALKLRNWLR